MPSQDIDLAQEQPESLLSPFDPELFVKHQGWTALEQILDGSGAGSYGLSGPRGAGKTWVMEKALERGNEKGGLGVWFPSPSEYEPTAFLAALSDVVATSFEAFHDKKTNRLTKVARTRFNRDYLGGGFLILLATLLLLGGNAENARWKEWFTFGNSILILLVAAGAILAIRALTRRRGEREGLGRVRQEAEELRRQVRYTVTATESDEFDLGAKHAGIGALLKRARERQLIERPATLSSLIHNFRAFVGSIAREIDGPVVIAVDELDKMNDALRVAQLLRDIKGIFDIPGVCFLVSISDEAARNLDLGAVRGRDEFNSSFYTVIAIPPFSPNECLELLRRRDWGFDTECGLALGVLTGGISRELVRVAELIRLEAGPAPSVDLAVAVALKGELTAFCAWALGPVAGKTDGLSDDARLAIFDAVEVAGAALGENIDELLSKLESDWNLNSDSSVWKEHFAEEWRRLLVRLGVAATLLSDSRQIRNPTRTNELQRIILLSAASAAVGRHRLKALRSQAFPASASSFEESTPTPSAS